MEQFVTFGMAPTIQKLAVGLKKRKLIFGCARNQNIAAIHHHIEGGVTWGGRGSPGEWGRMFFLKSSTEPGQLQN